MPLHYMDVHLLCAAAREETVRREGNTTGGVVAYSAIQSSLVGRGKDGRKEERRGNSQVSSQVVSRTDADI